MRGHNDICVIESNPGGKKNGGETGNFGVQDWKERLDSEEWVLKNYYNKDDEAWTKAENI